MKDSKDTMPREEHRDYIYKKYGLKTKICHKTGAAILVTKRIVKKDSTK